MKPRADSTPGRSRRDIGRADLTPGLIRRCVACPADARGRCRPIASGCTRKPPSQPTSRAKAGVARLLPAPATADRPRPTLLIPIPPR